MSDEDEFSSSPDIVMSRAEVAYMMRRKGLTLSEVAEELHTTPEQITLMLRARFRAEAEHMTSEDRMNILQMENDRLDYYLGKLWPSIEYGDVKAISLALGIHDRKMKANYLDRPDTSTQSAQILVIGGQEDNYIEALKAAADG
jgi:hypothetical protein